MMKLKQTVRVVAAAAAVVSITACAQEAETDTTNTLTIAAVDNVDLQRLQELSNAFTAEHPGTTIDWVVQGENEIRQTISTDVGTQAGRFDVVTIGAYETEVWADRDLLMPLTEMPESFAAEDFVPSVAEALSHEGELLAAPFYAESMFTMYRTDVLDEAGVDMPDQPTWEDILAAATAVSDAGGTTPMCLRGQPGWGENVAPLTAMAHAYGARWYDEEWNATLDSPEWTQVFEDYVALGQLAPDGIEQNGFAENLELFQNGECAIWVDTTSAASSIFDPEVSTVSDDVAVTAAPTAASGRATSWLWSWALAIPASSDNESLAKEFVAWATSGEYAELAAEELGWLNVPPGSRTDLYANPEYLEAAPFAPLVIESIESADVTDPAASPVPYVGLQYVAVPAFQSTGTAVGQQLTDAINGTVPIGEAQENSQWVTDRVISQYRLLLEEGADADNPDQIDGEARP